MYKGFKIRIYPTKEQEELLWKHIGCCRFIWNYMLDLQKKRYENGEKYLSAFDMMKLLTLLKNDGEHGWLYDVSNTSLQVVCHDLDKAYKRLFDKISRVPKIKSRKKSKPSYPVRCERFYFKDSHVLHVQKVGKMRYKTDFNFPFGSKGCKFCNVRISYDKAYNKWFISFNMECENQTPMLSDKSVGIDLGIKELAVVAHGDEKIVYHNINKSRRVKELERRKKHIQRSISRKYEKNRKGKVYVKTKNIEKQENNLRKVYRRISNIRLNYIHQTTHEIISLLPKRIIMENLDVVGMMKNKHLSKSISDQCFYEFIRQMKYKCENNGIEFIQVDRYYPSSKTCSCCGNIKKDLKLSDRTYHCPVCGNIIDRDFNAALNLSRYIA